jgi:hypothetical protein
MEKLDFIKCDVEGYEVHLFPHLINTISKFKPLIQIEISNAENRKQILDLLKPLGYKGFGIKSGALIELSDQDTVNYTLGDLYFKI